MDELTEMQLAAPDRLSAAERSIATNARPTLDFARLHRFCTEAAAAASMEQLRTTCAALAAASGFEYFLFALRVPTHFANARIVELDGAPPGWMARYFQLGHFNADPVLAHCARQLLPVRWSDLVTPADSPAGRVMDDAAIWGLREGVSMPVHSPLGELGVLSFATAQEPELVRDQTDAGLFTVQFAAVHVHHSVRRLTERLSPMRPLTQRETDCLRWAADGKTSAEIAQLLGLAESTANFHLNKAAEKLGVTTRQQAVALAALTGRVQPKPF